MGRWSAEHRKKAIFGWLAFVAIFFVLGQMAGTVKLDFTETGNGESHRAEQILADAGFKTPAGESVLIQTRDRSQLSTDPGFRAAVADVVTRVSAFSTVTNVRSPLENPEQIS